MQSKRDGGICGACAGYAHQRRGQWCSTCGQWFDSGVVIMHMFCAHVGKKNFRFKMPLEVLIAPQLVSKSN